MSHRVFIVYVNPGCEVFSVYAGEYDIFYNFGSILSHYGRVRAPSVRCSKCTVVYVT